MKIIKDKGKVTFTITGVTLGKLLAIQSAFGDQIRTEGLRLSPVGRDVYDAVRNAVEYQRLEEEEIQETRDMMRHEGGD